MSSWFSTVLGGSLGATAPPDTAAPPHEAAPPAEDGAAAAPGQHKAGDGFSDRLTYWTTMASSMGSSLAKESGFALVDRLEAGESSIVGDAGKELGDVEASCKAIATGVAEPTALWRSWAARLDAVPPERFYDAHAHEDVSLKTIILRSSALDTTIATVLRKPAYAADEQHSLVEFLDRVLVGSRAETQTLVGELAKLAENVDGTASHDRIQALVIAAFHQARCDHRYEDAMRETTDLLQHITVKEKELLALRNVAGGSSGAAAAQGAGIDGAVLLEVSAEVGDEELRECVTRTSELLDTNASLRHLVTIGKSLLQDRASRASLAEDALQEISAMRDDVGAHMSSVKSRILGATVCVCVCVCVYRCTHTRARTHTHTHTHTHTQTHTHTHAHAHKHTHNTLH